MHANSTFNIIHNSLSQKADRRLEPSTSLFPFFTLTVTPLQPLASCGKLSWDDMMVSRISHKWNQQICGVKSERKGLTSSLSSATGGTGRWHGWQGFSRRLAHPTISQGYAPLGPLLSRCAPWTLHIWLSWGLFVPRIHSANLPSVSQTNHLSCGKHTLETGFSAFQASIRSFLIKFN